MQPGGANGDEELTPKRIEILGGYKASRLLVGLLTRTINRRS